MDVNKQKEEFSLAYVRVIAARAGCGTCIPTPDDHSVDIEIKKLSVEDGPHIRFTDPQLAIQAKCTGQDLLNNGFIAFPLPIKNHNDLRKPKVGVPRILVVHLVPPDQQRWLLHSEKHMLVRQCSYWLSLRDVNATTNTDNVTVHVPQANVFSPASLLAIMKRIERGEPL